MNDLRFIRGNCWIIGIWLENGGRFKKFPLCHRRNTIFLHIQEVTYLGDYRLRLRFNDGQIKDVDLKDELHGEVFEPLRNQELFKQAHVDPDTQTVAWPHGADFAPEYLYEKGQTVRKIA